MIGRSPGGEATERLNNLRQTQEDTTLKNLLGILTVKLDLCSRLPVCEWEAAHDGDASSAAAFRRLAEDERRACAYLGDFLRQHLERRASAAAGGP